MPAAEYVYLVYSQFSDFVKIGRWKGSIKSLQSRYATYYPSPEYIIYQCHDRVLMEHDIFQELKEYKLCNELFDTKCIPFYIQFCSQKCYDNNEHEDLIHRIKRNKTATKVQKIPKQIVPTKIDKQESKKLYSFFENIIYNVVDDSIKIATLHKKQDKDIILEFVDEYCNLEPGNKKYRVSAKELWETFQKWNFTNEQNFITRKIFNKKIDEITKHSYKKRIWTKRSVDGWIGIDFKK